MVTNSAPMVLSMKLMMITYIMSKTHIVNNLIAVEFLAITLAATAFNSMVQLAMEMHVVIFAMVLFITESILGLSMLINVVRTHSNDFMKSGNIMTF